MVLATEPPHSLRTGRLKVRADLGRNAQHHEERVVDVIRLLFGVPRDNLVGVALWPCVVFISRKAAGTARAKGGGGGGGAGAGAEGTKGKTSCSVGKGDTASTEHSSKIIE